MMPPSIQVLIADDDSGDRQFLIRTLAKTGLTFQVTQVDNMAETVRQCEATRFDCLILDHQMPGQDGLSGLQALLESSPYLAVVIITGQGDEMVAARSFQLGATDYLPKNQITPELLEHSIRHSLEKVHLNRRLENQRQDLLAFASILHHDLQTPLHNIQLFTRLIENASQNGDQDSLFTYCQAIQKTCRQSSQLLETMMKYNRLRQDQVPFRILPMNPLIQTVIESLRSQIEQTGATIQCSSLPDLYGNETLLTQLFQNLLSNALQHRGPSPPIIRIDSRQSADHWEIRISDNGPGIDPSDQDRIFLPWVRLSDSHSTDQTSTSARNSGIGLGLATCRTIAQRHRGQIWCESHPGQGTRFVIRLPIPATDDPNLQSWLAKV